MARYHTNLADTRAMHPRHADRGRSYGRTPLGDNGNRGAKLASPCRSSRNQSEVSYTNCNDRLDFHLGRSDLHGGPVTCQAWVISTRCLRPPKVLGCLGEMSNAQAPVLATFGDAIAGISGFKLYQSFQICPLSINPRSVNSCLRRRECLSAATHDSNR